MIVLALCGSACADSKLKQEVHQKPKGEMQQIEDFTTQFIPRQEQEDFIVFYKDIMSKLQASKQKSSGKFSPVDQKKIEGYIAHGLRGLQMRTPQEFVRLQNEPTFKITCIRFGIYEQFMQEKSQKNSSIFARAQSYVRNVTYKLSQWFDSVKQTFTNA